VALADSLRAGGFYTQQGQAGVWTSMEAYLAASGAKLGLDAAISRYPGRFYGIGPSAAADEAYVPFMGSVAASLGIRLSPVFYAGPRLRFAASRTLELESGGLLSTEPITGSGGYSSNANMRVDFAWADNGILCVRLVADPGGSAAHPSPGFNEPDPAVCDAIGLRAGIPVPCN
jgi:hypothetical protein